MKRLTFPLLLGLGGIAILVALGVWQLQRLDWKQQMLAGIEARIGAALVAVPAAPDPQRDKYLPVRAEGLIGDGLQVLGSLRDIGPGHRIIRVFVLGDGRRVMVDLGFLPQEAVLPDLQGAVVTVLGNLHWPEEVDRFTPAPDLEKELWFARDVTNMAAVLGTEPVLIVTREVTPAIEGLLAQPVDTAGIPNDHLQYAITWFSLALVWAGMTGLLVWRIRRKTV